MGAVRVVLLVGMAGVLSGCAAGRVHQDVARLQSQIGLLDERVTQLERATGGGTPSASLTEPASEWTSTVGATPISHGARTSTPISTKASATTLTKPTTRQIQQALKNAGFYQGTVDGKMGSQTRDAIKEFQRVHGLKDDGVAGRQTWAKLNTYADLSSNANELNTAEVLK